MIHTVATFIHTNKLLSKDGLHLVALSGGADSVALLLVLADLGYSVEAVHCNFHLRGEESNRDESFCRELCESAGIRLHVVHFDTQSFAKLHGISIEMAARDLRYSYFHQLKKDLGAESICVAHHKDDLAETVLMNLVRGTGLLGLTGIRPKNGDVVRPFLCVGRKDIEAFLASRGQEFVTDSTNLVDDVTRNNVRLNIIPLLKRINPSVTDSVASTAQHVADALKLLEESTDEWIAKCTRSADETIEINIKALLGSPSPNHILYSILSRRGIPSQIITEISRHLHSQTGTMWSHKTTVILLDRGNIIISDKPEDFQKDKNPYNRQISPEQRQALKH